MEAVKSIDDFKKFIKLNRDKLYANAENADDITLDDEWMQDDQWDEIYKQYKHTLYSVALIDVPEYMCGDEFDLDEKKYAWKFIEELEKDDNVMDKNDDIIAFVKTKCR